MCVCASMCVNVSVIWSVCVCVCVYVCVQVCYWYFGADGGGGLYGCLSKWSHTAPENAWLQLDEEVLPDDRQEVMHTRAPDSKMDPFGEWSGRVECSFSFSFPAGKLCHGHPTKRRV